jgi:hypothetical protein
MRAGAFLIEYPEEFPFFFAQIEKYAILFVIN